MKTCAAGGQRWPKLSRWANLNSPTKIFDFRFFEATNQRSKEKSATIPRQARVDSITNTRTLESVLGKLTAKSGDSESRILSRPVPLRPSAVVVVRG